MTIHYQCACGAEIALPQFAAGRRARCRSCGLVFRVPRPIQPEWPAVTELADLGPEHARPTVPAPRTATRRTDRARTEPLVVKDPITGAPQPTSVGDGLTRFNEPQPTFWEDLAWSFVCFLKGGNLINLIFMTIAGLLVTVMGIASRFSIFAFLGMLFLGAWMCAFLFHVVTETAGGEDEWSLMSIDDPWEDVLRPALHCMGCSLIAFGPALGLAGWLASVEATAPLTAVLPLLVVGVLLWPILILASAIGNQLPLGHLHTLIRAILVAPASYAVICLSVVVAGGLGMLLAVGPVGLIESVFGARPPLGLVIAVIASVAAAKIYAALVSMRLIGLYYRHFKDDLPF